MSNIDAAGDPSYVKVSLQGGGDFYRAANSAVEKYLASPGTRRRGLRALYVKTCLQFALLIGSWSYLIIARPTDWRVFPALVGLGIGFTLVSFCVLHDANHGAFFLSRRKNHLLGWTSDVFLGFGSYAWRVKHNIAHHTYPNIEGYDDDIQQAPLARLSPSQPPQSWYRWQHLYMWPIYSLLVLRWHVGSDIIPFIRGRVASSELPFPSGWNLVGVITGKLLFIAWAFVIPFAVYPWWDVLIAYLGLSMLVSFVMTVTFQLAHCVEEAAFVTPLALRGVRRSWAIHEVESTVDFCQSNTILSWLIGGLNFQIEHHLFPRIPHTHYPHIASLVQGVAETHGVRYTAQGTLRSALGSHYRHLREMGRAGVRAEVEMG